VETFSVIPPEHLCGEISWSRDRLMLHVERLSDPSGRHMWRFFLMIVRGRALLPLLKKWEV